jgi:hypothetical protein
MPPRGLLFLAQHHSDQDLSTPPRSKYTGWASRDRECLIDERDGLARYGRRIAARKSRSEAGTLKVRARHREVAAAPA